MTEAHKCREIAIGHLISPNGVIRHLCEYHQGMEWVARDQSIEPWTLVRYHCTERGDYLCERVLQDGEEVPKREPLCGVCGLGLGVMLEMPPIEITCPRCHQWVEWRGAP